MAWYTINKL